MYRRRRPLVYITFVVSSGCGIFRAILDSDHEIYILFVKIKIIKRMAAMVMEHIAVEISPNQIPKHTQINIKMNIYV